MSTETAVSKAQRKLALARKRYAEADAFAASLPTEGFNADKAMTPALEKRGIAQRALWKAEDELKAALNRVIGVAT
jgi:hypothetical protein